MKPLVVALLALTAAVARDAAAVPKLEVDAAFPGGNIIVDSIDGDTIIVHRDLRDTAGDWFYYSFRVRGAAGRRITVNFTQRDPMVAFGPAVSLDGGSTWKWLGAENVTRFVPQALAILSPDNTIRSRFQYDVPATAAEVRFCLAMPYMEANLKAFLKRHQNDPHLRVETLCKTRKGRDTEALYLGRLDGKAQIRALITARHHACEMMASHAVEGIMESILGDTPDGHWLREHVEFLIIPFMDKDGVEDGDQGKNRKPRDHNRDYGGDSIHPSVAALRILGPKWSQGKLRFALDMHCPAHQGRCHEVIYGLSGNEQNERFAKILESVESGPLVFRAEDYAPCRGASNGPRPASGEAPLQTFGNWSRTLPGVLMSGLIELPYSTATGRPVTIESANLFGRDVAKAMRRYFEEIH